jgi:hypothetical protein
MLFVQPHLQLGLQAQIGLQGHHLLPQGTFLGDLEDGSVGLWLCRFWESVAREAASEERSGNAVLTWYDLASLGSCCWHSFHLCHLCPLGFSAPGSGRALSLESRLTWLLVGRLVD